jgi:hypothetical protein
MMRSARDMLLARVTLLAACSGFLPAHADDGLAIIDPTLFACSAFLQSLEDGHETEMRDLTIWLDGYLASIAGDRIMNRKNFRQFFDELLVYCRAHEASTLMEAAHHAGD